MPRQYTPRVQCRCANCGKPFTETPSRVAEGRGKHCSTICAFAAHTEKPEIRFWSKVDGAAEPDGCWEWQAGLSSSGYGRFRLGSKGSPNVQAHRFSWELTHGPIPDEAMVLHTCDNRRCVNPAHLFLGTAQDNSHDMHSKGRGLTGAQHALSKLSEDDVRVIRRRYAAGEANGPQLSREYGVAVSLVYRIVRGEAWRHVA